MSKFSSDEIWLNRYKNKSYSELPLFQTAKKHLKEKQNKESESNAKPNQEADKKA